MMLDVTTLLHNAEDLDLQLDNDYEVELGANARLQNTFAVLDIRLARLADRVGWTNVWQPHSVKKLSHPALVELYRAAVDSCLLFSAKKKWTELVVFTQDQYQKIVGAERFTKNEDLNREYLAMKHFFDNSYFMHHREDFRHGWHLLVKLGICDLAIDPDELVNASQAHLKRMMK